MTARTDVAKNEPRKVNVLPYEHKPDLERAKYARILAGAGLIPSGLRGPSLDATAANVFLVLETGAMLGLAPMAAIAGIDVIEGRAAISPRVALGLMRAQGIDIDIEEFGAVETGDLGATVTMTRRRPSGTEEVLSATFTLKDALRADLLDSYAPNAEGEWILRATSKNGKVLPWQAYPHDMVVWRAVSRIMRRGAQDVMMGIGYIPEELEARVTEEGVREDFGEAEDAIIEEIKGYSDKADMAALYLKHNRRNLDTGVVETSDAWTKRVGAAFDAHLSTLTIDSRPPRDGAPGHTGVAAVDGEHTDEPHAPQEDTNTPSDGETGDPGDPEAVREAYSAAEEGVVDAEIVDETPIDTHREVSVEDADAAEREDLRRRAEAALEREAREGAARAFKSDALEG